MKKLSIFCSLALVLALMAGPVCAQQTAVLWIDIDGDGQPDDCIGAEMMVNDSMTIDVYLDASNIPVPISTVGYRFHWSSSTCAPTSAESCLKAGPNCFGPWDTAPPRQVNSNYYVSLFENGSGVPVPDAAIKLSSFVMQCTGVGNCSITIDAIWVDDVNTVEYLPDEVGCTINQVEVDWCEMYYERYLTCVDLRDAGREVDYDICKNLSYLGQTVCEAYGCTWHKNSPNRTYPCLLDMCLMDWDGNNSSVGPIDFGIFVREQGRGPCPTTHQPEDDLCQMYDNKYQTCVTLQAAGREVDYNVCKAIQDQGDCIAAGCTWHKSSPIQAYPCMLDMCLMDWDGNSGSVGPLDFGIFITEQGRGPCP